MPQFTNNDRQMIVAEATLWNALELLNQIESAGAFSDRLDGISMHLDKLASEMKAYNDQFGEE